jgi:hypothetical protein
MKKHSNMTPRTTNDHTTKDLNDGEVGKITNTELRRIVRMVSKMKEDVYKHINEGWRHGSSGRASA